MKITGHTVHLSLILRTLEGGAIFIWEFAHSYLEHVTFNNNKAKYGGAIYNLGSLTLDYGAFTNNIATDKGGAIWNSGGIHLGNFIFSKNSAKHGSAIYSEGGGLGIFSSTFSENIDSIGGALHAYYWDTNSFKQYIYQESLCNTARWYGC